MSTVTVGSDNGSLVEPAISIKTARTGFTGSQRVHHFAEGLGLEVVMGNQVDGQLGTACAITFGAAYQLTSRHAGELSNFLDMSDDLLAEPLRIENGELRVPRGPGLGIQVDEDKLAHYRTDSRARHLTVFGSGKEDAS